ncbi:MAG: CAP domain-containing protein [Eubacteriales bacterium]|nr:CAP domain-containing protein [Eubacteriales bacterium]
MERKRMEQSQSRRRPCIGLLVCLLAFLLVMPAAAATGVHVDTHTSDEIINYIRANGATLSDPIAFAEEPSVTVPYSAGALTAETQNSAVSMLNQVRYIAGLPSNIVVYDEYSRKCQAGSLVNAVNKDLSHTPTKPEDMDNELYQLGYKGAGSSNIGAGYWNLNQDIVHGWMADKGAYNLNTLGHRRWILNPEMKRAVLDL